MTGLLTFLACAFAIFIVFSEASIAVTSAPKLANDSDKIPPPQPTSRTFFPLKLILSLMKLTLKGLI